MENILIIKKNARDLFFDRHNNIESYFSCTEKNILFKICKKLKIPLNIFFGKWKKNIHKYDIVILFDNGYNYQISRYIKKKNKKIKIIFWYWNSLVEYKNKLIDDTNIDEIWTYNRFDAEKYGINYNPQFYDYVKKTENKEVKYDVVFMGRSKGRKEELLKLQNKFEEKSLTTNFNIIENEKNIIDYNLYLEKVLESKCILDYSISKKCGLSLRPLEALFFEKKLITNNIDIVNYKFYNKNNIFILGVDDLEEIEYFFHCEYKPIEPQIINYYSFEMWKERFCRS